MKKDLVSVIVPVYNVEEYLDECIQSIVNQSYKNLEIILVDDGAKDNSGNVCDQWKEKDDRIKVIHQENMGASGARNSALDMIEGEYICFVDSDDTIDEQYIELMYQNMIDNNSDMCIGQYYRKDLKSGEKIYEQKSDMINNNMDWRYFMKMVYQNNYYATSCIKLFKAFLFDNVRYPIGKKHEDSAVILDIAIHCHNISQIEEALYYYRERPLSIMNEKNSVLYNDDFEWIKKHIEKLMELKEEELAFEAKKLYCHYVIKNHKYIGKSQRESIFSQYKLYYKDVVNSKYIAPKTRLKYNFAGRPAIIKFMMLCNL